MRPAVRAPLLTQPGFAELGAPFVEAGVLELCDVHVVDLLAPLGGPGPPEVLLGLSLGVRAPRHGHVGVDLRTVRATVFHEASLGELDAEERIERLPWPTDVDGWLDAVRASPLVSDVGSSALRPFVLHDGLLMPEQWWRHQERLAAAIRARLAGGSAELPVGGHAAPRPIDAALLRCGLEQLFPEPRSRGQRLAALLGVLRPLAVISGGPGTGKTTTVKSVLALLRAQWLGAGTEAPRVALAAPTGKAAVRMQEAIRAAAEGPGTDAETRAWLGSLEASTLHRLLGAGGARRAFRHDADRPLEHDVVIVDEASMIDLRLMRHLVDAVRPDARLLLLGDRDQLASVAAGTVLGDLTGLGGGHRSRWLPEAAARLRAIDPEAALDGSVGSDAPVVSSSVVHLRETFRFAEHSGIGQVARAIARAAAVGDELGAGALGEATAWLTGGRGSGQGAFADLSFYPHEQERLSAAALGTILAQLEPMVRLARTGADDPVAQQRLHAAALAALARFRVLCAHRRGALGVAGMNELIGRSLRGRLEGRTDGGTASVATLAERWPDDGPGRPVIVTENRYDLGRMNGDVGLVVRSHQRGQRRVAFPGRSPGSIEYIELGAMPAHETVFAMTIHKSQGSEFEHALVVLPARMSRILTRELLYTAVTRAARQLGLAGSAEVVGAALARRVERASSLATLLSAPPQRGG